MTHTKTHTRITFANPYLLCDWCKEPVPAMRSDTNANIPCGHLGVTSACPSWGPVDGCTCADANGHQVAPAPCKVCGGRRFYFDSDGHGGQTWKRPCTSCAPSTGKEA